MIFSPRCSLSQSGRILAKLSWNGIKSKLGAEFLSCSVQLKLELQFLFQVNGDSDVGFYSTAPVFPLIYSADGNLIDERNFSER